MKNSCVYVYMFLLISILMQSSESPARNRQSGIARHAVLTRMMQSSVSHCDKMSHCDKTSH
jgi:hypothetical protein